MTTPADRDSTPADESRRRKLGFRCWHRGTREMDLLLGRFADANLAAMSDAEVAELERLVEAPDPELFGWIAGTRPVPANYDTPMLAAIRDFHRRHPVSGAI
ncbi:succinate dehydrogenase assembly factor 2 [Tepidamorphus gemmatus]|uniref:FAD assembly factor SdhE n=1 Tax=Tepidamorphus gemmatus TaxID=747076 RepID=UPI001FDEE609|nr:succinate dehydrogenase assembly factor 2 [Tepidamorphus gemmatus]